MSFPPTRSIQVDLSVYSILAREVYNLDCHDCDLTLDITQPDSSRPDLLIGSCQECGRLYQIEMKASPGRALVIRLPQASELYFLKPPPSELT